MSWTLQHDTTTQSLADWGLSDGVLTEQNLSAGELSFAFDGDQLAAALAKHRSSSTRSSPPPLPLHPHSDP
jgi:hypothetical protein